MKNNPKLKIGLVFDDSLDSNDGVSQYVKLLGVWLSGQGHQVSYLVGQTELSVWGSGLVYSLAKNISVRFNGNKLSMPIYANKKVIKKLLSERQFDILHVMVPYSPFMAQRVINLAPPSTVVVGTFHIFPAGWLSRYGSWLLKQLLRPSLSKFSAFVSVSNPAAGFAKSAYSIKSSVVPNPVDIGRFASKSAKIQRKSERQIVFLGRLVKRKGAAELIEAFALLSKTVPECRLSIAGSGPQSHKLKSLVEKLGLESRVDFLGYIKEADKAQLLQSADIACFPSLYGESFGIVLVEAMAAGSRVVMGGDNPGYRSVLNEQPLLLVDPRNTTVFAARLARLLNDKVAGKELYGWQQRTVKQYDINVVGAQILDFYTQQIAPPAKKSNNKAHE